MKDNILMSALLIIDMQNKWVSEGKVLVPERGAAIKAISSVRSLWTKKGLPVIFVTMVHEPDGSSLSRFDAKIWNVRGSQEAEIIPELRPSPSDRILEKTRYSAFFGTNLARLLKSENVSSCVITGYQARACVLATALDAYQNDIEPVILSEGVLETDSEYLSFYLRSFKDADILKTLDEVEAIFGADQ